MVQRSSGEPEKWFSETDGLKDNTDPLFSWLSIARTMVRMAIAASGHKDTRPEMVVAHWLAGTPNTKVQMVSKSSCKKEIGKSSLGGKFLTIVKYVYMLYSQSVLAGLPHSSET